MSKNVNLWRPVYVNPALSIVKVLHLRKQRRRSASQYLRGPPRGFGDSGRMAIYFQGFGEKGHSFSGIWGESGVLGSREQGAQEKHFRELGRKVIFLSGSREQRPPPLEGPQLRS